MFRIAVIACMSLVLTAAGLAQTQALPADLAALPDQIKNLKWQTVDLSALPALDHCRALLLLNHALGELSANATSEADLMSTYIQTQNLGSQFANTPAPPPPARQLAFTDVEKIAVALLRGPMSKSYYATELGDASPAALASYGQMYERTCQRRWNEFDEAKGQVRAMASFLGNSQKLNDYQTWAAAEAARRQQQFQQKQAANQAQQQNAAAQQAAQAQRQQLQQQNQQLQQALGAAESQQQYQAQQTAQAQQQAAQAQQQADQAQQSAPQGYVTGAAAYGAYGVYGGYGVPAYYGANTAWSRDAAYTSVARDQTEARMSSFHGAAAVRR